MHYRRDLFGAALLAVNSVGDYAVNHAPTIVSLIPAVAAGIYYLGLLWIAYRDSERKGKR